MTGDGLGLDQQGATCPYGVEIALPDEGSNPARGHPQLFSSFARRQEIQPHVH